MSIRDEILKKLRKNMDSEERARVLTEERAKAASKAWASYHGKNLDGVARFGSDDGGVTIGHIEYAEQDGTPCVLVWTGPKKGHPQYRFINPPILVENPNGSVEISYTVGEGKQIRKKFEEDPVKAIAEGIVNSRGGRIH